MISIIIGTNRVGSQSTRVARAYSKILTEHDVPNQIFDLSELPKEVAFSDLYGARTKQMEKLIETYIEDVDHFVFVLPEYNGGFPGIVKVMIDAIPPALFHDKWAALVGVSSGRAGNLRGLDAFGNVLNYLKVNTLYAKPKLSGIEGLWENGRLNESSENQLRKQAKMLIDTMSM